MAIIFRQLGESNNTLSAKETENGDFGTPAGVYGFALIWRHCGDFISKGYSIDYVRSFSAVLQQSFRFAVFPKQFITFNPMQYVVMRHKKEETDLFADETATDRDKVKPLSFEMYRKLIEQLGKRSGDAILPVQIAYFTGLRLGEVAGLTWQDINLEEQYLTVRRSIRYNGATHKHEIGPTKWKKIRVVDFGDTSQIF